MTPYFQKETERQPYFCPGCKGWFYRGVMSCCVLHAPGTCCHEFEIRASAPTKGRTV